MPLKLLTTLLLLSFSSQALAGPITYLFEGTFFGSPRSAEVTFDVGLTLDSDPDPLRTSFIGPADGDNWLVVNGLTSPNSSISVVDGDTDSLNISLSVPFVGMERFTESFSLVLLGADIFNQERGGLTGSVSDITTFLDNVDFASLSTNPVQVISNDGSGGTSQYNIDSVTRVVQNVPEPSFVLLLASFLLGRALYSIIKVGKTSTHPHDVDDHDKLSRMVRLFAKQASFSN